MTISRIAPGDPLGRGPGGVVNDVEHGLDELLAVAPEVGQRDVVVALDGPSLEGSIRTERTARRPVDVHVADHLGAVRASRRSTRDWSGPPHG